MASLRGRAVDYTFNAFLIHIGMALVGAILSKYNWWLVTLIYSVLTERGLIIWTKKESRTVYYLLVVMLVAMRQQYLIPSMVVLLTTWDQQKLKGKFKVMNWVFETLHMVVEDVQLPYITPYVGSNNVTMLVMQNIFRDWMTDTFDGIKQTLNYGPVTRVTYLRKIDVSEVPQVIPDKPVLPADQVVGRWDELEGSTKWGVALAALILCYIAIGPFTLIPVVVSLMLIGIEEEPNLTIKDMNRGITFRDGIYLVQTTVYGIETSRGIGVAMDGVFHTPYHVVRSRPVYYGSTLVQPYLIDIREDLTVYGGPPKITQVSTADKVYVNCETESSRTSYEVSADVDTVKGVIAWQGVTKPGESGSPVLGLRQEEDGMKMVLLGLAGRFINDKEGCTEYSNITPRNEKSSLKEQIMLHPGAGKTWRVIPEQVRKFLAEPGGQRVLVAGPTRVVCKELHASLKRETSVGLNIKGSVDRNEHARVQVAAHRTALRMLTNNSRSVRHVGLIIIDEAHMDDAATKLLRKYSESAMSRGVRVIELSATLDGITNEESNYTITDIEIRSEHIEDKIHEALNQGDRVLAFLPSMKGKLAKRLKREFKDHKPILLSRETFVTAMKDVSDEERRLILSTDIAECGINIPGLDTIIDAGEKFTYVYEGGFIVGKKVGISRASRTQRRGRVGRSKEGKYLEVKSNLSTDYISAAEFDAQMLASGRNWAYGKTDWGLMLTDQQFRVWSDEDLTPLEVWLNYDNLGLPRSSEMKRDIFKDLRSAGNYYIGCYDECGRCQGKYKYFDERCHDRIVTGVSAQSVKLW